MTIDELTALHQKSSYHKKEMDENTMLSCFYCEKTSKITKIKEWTDKKQTALCPRCGIDSCLPGQYTKNVLREMNKHYF